VTSFMRILWGGGFIKIGGVCGHLERWGEECRGKYNGGRGGGKEVTYEKICTQQFGRSYLSNDRGVQPS